MVKVMFEFIIDLQYFGMLVKDLDEIIEFYMKKFGFELVGLFYNGENCCVFLCYGYLIIEMWEGDLVLLIIGVINYWVFDIFDIEVVFENVKEFGLNFKDNEIQYIDSFWEYGICYFNVYGLNGEIIEFCQIVK